MTASVHWRPRFSIRLLLAAAAAVGVAQAMLMNASQDVLAAVAGGAFVLYLFAALGQSFAAARPSRSPAGFSFRDWHIWLSCSSSWPITKHLSSVSRRLGRSVCSTKG